MSKLLPQSTIDAYRQAARTVIDMFGIECTLFIANNLTSIESLDAFQTAADRTYTEVETTCFVEWSPSTYFLKKFGIFTEGNLPIIAKFRNDLDITIGSYIEVAIQYIPSNTYDTDKFEVVNKLTPNLHDMEIFQYVHLSPLREVTNG